MARTTTPKSRQINSPAPSALEPELERTVSVTVNGEPGITMLESSARHLLIDLPELDDDGRPTVDDAGTPITYRGFPDNITVTDADGNPYTVPADE